MSETKWTLDHFGHHFLGVRLWSEGFTRCVHKGQQIRTLDQESDQAKMKMTEEFQHMQEFCPAAAEGCGFWSVTDGDLFCHWTLAKDFNVELEGKQL